VYDPVFNGMPMSALPYAQAMDHQYLLGMVSTQLDYYFSLDNLLKDTFLRKHMDSQGFVFFDVIVNFPRVKNLSPDRDLIKTACLKSDVIEIRVGEDGKERLRKREGWQQFVLPMDQRETASQTDGPKVLHRPEAPQLQTLWQTNPAAQYHGPASAGPVQRASFDIPPYAMNGMVPPFSPYPNDSQDAAVFGEGSEELTRGRALKSPTKEFGAFSNQQSFADPRQSEPDTFLDQNVNELNVIYKPNPNPGRAPFHSSSSRTFSNGSIDTRNIASEIEKLSESSEPATTNGRTVTNGDVDHTKATPDLIQHDPNDKNAEVIFLWLKDQVIQQDDIPKGTHVQPYITLRAEALAQRERAPPSTCPHDLDILYKFWSHFLIRNFNARMYGEFKYYAITDARQRDNVLGLTQLVNFYVNALKSNTHIIRDLVVVDYIELVKDQPPNFQNYAFKQLRQAWRDGATNLKNRKKLTQYVDETLRTQLES
jgi:la-related protein 1